ncbi:hypothetical protein HII12_002042 [Brettanomyces bruxellensis]|uniref:V-type ATPase assembly factor PKR1 n=1 Tax=Dekkera bruxellensis TaxID=5007 RepID=A0A8H6EWY5_DEKBR|nr:hypothetical protein HII12_002042 [Brettanomyces bruxellensis]
MSFFADLWKSVFEPGANSALVQATHGSFFLLTLSLIWMIYTTHSIHFINLLVISSLLWMSVVWFLSELKKAKLKSNEEIAKDDEDHAESAEKTEKADNETKNGTQKVEKETEGENKKEK